MELARSNARPTRTAATATSVYANASKPVEANVTAPATPPTMGVAVPYIGVNLLIGTTGSRLLGATAADQQESRNTDTRNRGCATDRRGDHWGVHLTVRPGECGGRLHLIRGRHD